MKPLDPIGKATPEEIKAYLEHATRKNTPQRWQLFRNCEFNRLYMQNQQWLEEAIGAEGVVGVNGAYSSPFLQPISDGSDYAPRPVHNEMLPVIQNEVARMVASGSTVSVPPNDGGPKIKKGAKLAQDVLRAKDAEINFKGLKQKFVRSQALDGLGIFISEQQTDYCKTIRKPKDVMGCMSCRWSASVDDHDKDDGGIPILKGMSAVGAARNGAAPLNFRMSGPNPVFDGGLFGDDQPEALMTKCPECGSDLIPRLAERSEDQDYAGNDVHKEIPLGDIFTGVITAMDFFPYGAGRLDPDGTVRRWATEEIVSLDWLAQFYEDGYKVKGDDQELRELARWHPQGFEDGTYVIDADQSDFDGQAILRRSVRLPYFESDDKGRRKYYDRGRITVMAGKVILIDDDLMIQDKRSGDWVPRCMIHTAPWEPIKGSIWGNALATYLRSPQDNENTAFAQAIEARHDFGSPKMWLRDGQNIEFLGQSYGGTANSVYRITGGGELPVVKPGTPLNEQWKAEVQEYKEAIQRIASSRDVENGNAPAGVVAAQALRILAEAATVTRGPRIAATKAAIESLDKHRLQLMGILYKEKRDFKAGGRGDRISIQSFRGADLMGQCDVTVEIEPFIESSVLRAQAASEGLTRGTLTLRTAGDRQRFNASQGVPADIAPGEGMQVEMATDEWLDFVDNTDENGETKLTFGEPPVVKEGIDDDAIHAEQHIIEFMSWEGEELRKNLNPIYIKIDGWKDKYAQLVEMEADLKANPPGDLPPTPPENADGTVNAEAVQALAKQWAMKKQFADTLETMPKLAELRIFEIWQKMCAEGKAIELGEADLAALRWLAHRESHLLNVAKKAAADLAAAQVAPVQQKPAGPQPAPGAQEQAAPGMVA